MIAKSIVSIVLVSFAIVVQMAEETASGNETRPNDAVFRILDWLPEDTETVLFAKGPIVAQRPVRRVRGRVVAETRIVDGHPVQVYVDEATGGPIPTPRQPSFPQQALRATTAMFEFDAEDLSKQHLEFAIWIGRKFGKIEGSLGISSYEGCQVAVFQNPVSPETIRMLERRAESTSRISGYRVFCVPSDESDDGEKDSLYFSQPMRNVLVVANSPSYVTDLLARVSRREKSKAFPVELVEWKHVDLASPAWGIRHYRSTKADKDAIGVTYSFQEESNTIAVHYVSSSNRRDEIVTKYFEALGLESVVAKKLTDTSAVANMKIGPKLEENVGLLAVLAIMGWFVFI